MKDANDPHLLLGVGKAKTWQQVEKEKLCADIGEVGRVSLGHSCLVPWQPPVVVFSCSPASAGFDHEEMVVVHEVSRAECGRYAPQQKADHHGGE